MFYDTYICIFVFHVCKWVWYRLIKKDSSKYVSLLCELIIFQGRNFPYSEDTLFRQNFHVLALRNSFVQSIQKKFTRFPCLAFTYCAHLLFQLASVIRRKYKRKPCKYFFGMDQEWTLENNITSRMRSHNFGIKFLASWRLYRFPIVFFS